MATSTKSKHIQLSIHVRGKKIDERIALLTAQMTSIGRSISRSNATALNEAVQSARDVNHSLGQVFSDLHVCCVSIVEEGTSTGVHRSMFVGMLDDEKGSFGTLLSKLKIHSNKLVNSGEKWSLLRSSLSEIGNMISAMTIVATIAYCELGNLAFGISVSGMCDNETGIGTEDAEDVKYDEKAIAQSIDVLRELQRSGRSWPSNGEWKSNGNGNAIASFGSKDEAFIKLNDELSDTFRGSRAFAKSLLAFPKLQSTNCIVM